MCRPVAFSKLVYYLGVKNKKKVAIVFERFRYGLVSVVANNHDGKFYLLKILFVILLLFSVHFVRNQPVLKLLVVSISVVNKTKAMPRRFNT